MESTSEGKGNGGPQATPNDSAISKDGMSTIERLPANILYEIISNLPQSDTCRMMSTSRPLWSTIRLRCIEDEALSSNFLLGWATYHGHHRLMKFIIDTLKPRENFLKLVNRKLLCSFIPPVEGEFLQSYPIHLAIMRNDDDAWMILGRSTVTWRRKDSDGCNILHYSRIDPGYAKVALIAGADANHEDWVTMLTPLQRILSYDERFFVGPPPKATRDAVKMLLADGRAKPNKFRDLRQSPLCLAFQHSPRIVKLLLEYGADPNFMSPSDIDRDAHTALTLATVLPKDGVKIVELLLDHGANMDEISGRTTPLIYALDNRCYPTAISLVCSGANLNIHVPDGDYEKSPLTICSRDGEWDLVQDLIDEGADVNFSVANPLYYAARFLLYEDIEKLLDLGANPNCPVARPGITPFAAALCMRKRDKLHRSDAPSTPKDDEAFEKERSQILDLLMENGVELYDPENGIDYSPLFQTMEHGGVKEFEQLLEYDVTVSTIVRPEGYHVYTPLHHALQKCEKKDAMTDFLLERGANPLAGHSEASGARHTPLGEMIWKSETAWTDYKWFHAVHFLCHKKVGVRVTEHLDEDTLALWLFHTIALSKYGYNIEENIKTFANLTNFENRWGPDGISGILALVGLPIYWEKSWYYCYKSPYGVEKLLYNPPILATIRLEGATAVARLCTGGEELNVRELQRIFDKQRAPPPQNVVDDDE